MTTDLDTLEDMDPLAAYEQGLPVVIRGSAAFDPSGLGFPPMLPVELAMGEDTPKMICESYGISKERFKKLCANTLFQKAFQDAKDMLMREGMSFQTKARLQAEHLLDESWKIIHNPHTPANVRAQLIQATWKISGYEPKPGVGSGVAGGFQINIQLNNN